MGGGDIELISYGTKDKFIQGDNSSLTFFLKTFAPHSNFAQELIDFPFDKRHSSYTQKQTISINIPRSGDLIQQMYIQIDLPPIYSSRSYAFRWIPFVGEYILESYQLRVGPSIIERKDSDIHHVLKELNTTLEKYSSYNRLIGNIPNVYQPEFSNNGVYPRGKKGSPSISGRTLVIPLHFPFQDSGMAFPLIGSQRHEVEFKATIRPFSQLYLLQQHDENNALKYLPPDTSNPNHSIFNFMDINYKNETKSQIQTNQQFLGNYIFIGSKERTFFAKSLLTYIIPQTHEHREVIKGKQRIDLPFQNPTKEIIWILRPADYASRNGYLEYADKIGHHMRSARLLSHNQERIKDFKAEIFNHLQPWQHHTSGPREGVYVYSFALDPESDQPTGHWNLSMANNLQLEITPRDNESFYEVVVYAVSYNRMNLGAGRVELQFQNS